MAAVFQGFAEIHVSYKSVPRGDETALSPVRSGLSCKGCSAAEGLFSLAQSVWGSWEEALQEIAGLSAETKVEQPRRHGSPLLTAVSRLPGCSP